MGMHPSICAGYLKIYQKGNCKESFDSNGGKLYMKGREYSRYDGLSHLSNDPSHLASIFRRK